MQIGGVGGNLGREGLPSEDLAAEICGGYR
jgi:hypothetical protein